MAGDPDGASPGRLLSLAAAADEDARGFVRRGMDRAAVEMLAYLRLGWVCPADGPPTRLAVVDWLRRAIEHVVADGPAPGLFEVSGPWGPAEAACAEVSALLEAAARGAPMAQEASLGWGGCMPVQAVGVALGVHLRRAGVGRLVAARERASLGQGLASGSGSVGRKRGL